jgi:hypothetical protein
MTPRWKSPLPDLMEFSYLVEDLQDKPDTDLALLSMAYLDRALEFAIRGKLSHLTAEGRHNLFGSANAPLRDLHAKIELGASMGCFGPVATSDLRTLRSIRNVFAHRFEGATWDHPQVAPLIKKLSLTASTLSADTPGPHHIEESIDVQVRTESGRVIDTNIHMLITDDSGRVGFFCREKASAHVSDSAKRRYLESYWCCIFQVMRAATFPWFEDMNANTEIGA